LKILSYAHSRIVVQEESVFFFHNLQCCLGNKQFHRLSDVQQELKQAQSIDRTAGTGYSQYKWERPPIILVDTGIVFSGHLKNLSWNQVQALGSSIAVKVPATNHLDASLAALANLIQPRYLEQLRALAQPAPKLWLAP
jgi:hypothetical protein